MDRSRLRSSAVPVALACIFVWGSGCTAPRDGADSDHVPHASSANAFPIGLSFGDRLAGATPAEVATALDDVVRLGANWIRIDLSWARLQPTTSDSFDWTGVDQVVGAARARDLRVLGILGYTPPWARAEGCDTFSCPPASLTAFADFSRAVVEHLEPYGVRTYEVWNEPNLPKFWTNPDPVAYRNLLVRTADAVHDTDPGATVLFGGLAPTATRDGALNAGTFLQLACASGACATADGVAYHPYTFPRTPSAETTGNTAWERIEQDSPGEPSIRSVLREAGLEDRALWLTEFGAPTGGVGTAADGSTTDLLDPAIDHVTEELQERIVVEGVSDVLDHQDEFGGFFVYTWRDLDEYGDTEDHFGLRRTDGSPKPAWAGFRRAIGRR